MRTGTLARPSEIVPLQSEGAMTVGYPLKGLENREAFSKCLARETRLTTRGRTFFEATPPNGGLGTRPPTRRPRHVYERGISLWKMWKSAGFAAVSAGCWHLPDCAEPHTAPAAQLLARLPLELLERFAHSISEQTRSLFVVCVSPVTGLRDDRVDHPELETVTRVRLESGGRLAGLAGVAPENGRATLGRDHCVNRVLLHQNAVGERRCNRASRTTLADHAGDRRNAQPRHQRLRAGNRSALAVLLGDHAWVRARDVHQRHDREAVPFGQIHRAHRLAVTLRVGHAEVASRPLLHVPALLVADQHDRPPAKAPDPGDKCGVVTVLAVAVQLEPVLEQAVDVVQGVRPFRVARELDRAPDLLVARLCDDPLELPLETLKLPGQPRAAQQRQAPEAAQLLPEPQLRLTCHGRRGVAAAPASRAAGVEGRLRPRGRGGSWTRRGRSRRAASRASSAARLAAR